MSTPPTNIFGANEIVQSYVKVEQEQMDVRNQTKILIYQAAYANWLNAGQQGSAPSAPQLEQLDQTQLANIFISWVQTGCQGLLNYSQAFSLVDIAPLQPPVPPPPSTGKLGPLLAAGQWAKLANDPSVPGTTVVVNGTTYVLKAVPSPFGWFGVHWEVA